MSLRLSRKARTDGVQYAEAHALNDELFQNPIDKVFAMGGAATAPNYQDLAGEFRLQSTAPVRYQARDLRVRLSANVPANNSLRFVLRVNGADTALSVLIPAGQSVGSSSAKVRIEAGALIDWRVVQVGGDPLPQFAQLAWVGRHRARR